MRHSGKKDVNNVPLRRRYNASEAVVEIRESLPLLIIGDGCGKEC